MKNHDEQQHLFDALDKQKQHQKVVNRALYIVIPITAFLIAVMCANLHPISLAATFIVLLSSLFAVAIKGQNWRWWMLVTSIFVLVDHYILFGSFEKQTNHLLYQYVTMVVFLLIFALGRPYLDRWVANSTTSKL